MKIVINENNLQIHEIEEFRHKVKAILVNDNNEILVANYGGAFFLPGGSINENETIVEVLIRELSEEIGLNYDLEELYYLTTIEYFQKNYPKRDNSVKNRLVKTHYFTGKYKGKFLFKQRLLKKEMDSESTLQLISIDELKENISNDKNNSSRHKFFQNEILTLLDNVELLEIK